MAATNPQDTANPFSDMPYDWVAVHKGDKSGMLALGISLNNGQEEYLPLRMNDGLVMTRLCDEDRQRIDRLIQLMSGGPGTRVWYYQGDNKKSEEAVRRAAQSMAEAQPGIQNIMIPRFGPHAVEGVSYVDLKDDEELKKAILKAAQKAILKAAQNINAMTENQAAKPLENNDLDSVSPDVEI